MKKSALVTLLLLVVLFLLPLFIRDKTEPPAETTLDEVLQSGPSPQSQAPISQLLQEKTKDSEITVRVLMDDGTVESMSLDSYLFGVVAAEMPASFETEALKAQAVAARTYTLYRVVRGGAHENADVCTDSTCCKAYSTTQALEAKWGADASLYGEKIWAAVRDTSGEAIYYDGALIDAVFHSSSAGETQSALEVWGRDVAYLQSVPTYGEEISARYNGQAVFSLENFKTLFLAAYPQADFSGPTEDWLSAITYNDAGAVASCTIGSVPVSGVEARRIFGLQSTRFSYAVEESNIVFTTLGYGHGVGMSQYGANAMAKDGYDYKGILEHYYTGAQVEAVRAEGSVTER